MKQLLYSLLLFSSIAVYGQKAVPTYSHVKYGDGENSWLNIYLAKSGNPTPVVVWAHANGQDVTADNFPAGVWEALQVAGISVISWESVPRITQAEEVGQGEKDFNAVMNWLNAHYKEYNIDVNKVVISGQSRGSVISFAGANKFPVNIKGAYFVQALPNMAWKVRDFTKDISKTSPLMVMAYAEAPGSKDGHTPDNGKKIEERYKELGIADRFTLYHSLGKAGLYSHLAAFVKKVTFEK